MTKKETFKNNILMQMKRHLNKDALAILDIVLSETLYRVDIVDNETLPATQDLTNEYLFSLYELKRSPKLSESSYIGYVRCVKEFLRYVDKPLTQMKEEDVEYYLRQKIREGNVGTTLNSKRRMLSQFFKFMKKYKFIQENPVDNIDPYREVKKPVEHLEPEEWETLKEACKSKRDRALLEYLRCTACRKGEIPDVRINQVNWATGKITIFGEKTQTYRVVCLDTVAIKYITEYIRERGLDLKSNQPLFVHCRGDRSRALTRNGIYAEVKRIAEGAGLEKSIYPHLFRKTTATNIVRRGGNDTDAGYYLGHKPHGVTGTHYIYRGEDQTIKIFQSYVAAV